MANIGQSDNRYQDSARGQSVLAPNPGADSVWRWLHPWRWPAGLLAGIVLWLALVAVAGAAIPIGGPTAASLGVGFANNPFVINNSFLRSAGMPSSFGGNLPLRSKHPINSRSSLTPRP
jgi:hypothetical protein